MKVSIYIYIFIYIYTHIYICIHTYRHTDICIVENQTDTRHSQIPDEDKGNFHSLSLSRNGLGKACLRLEPGAS